jgi:Leucine-rich repeat (LRR) protein
MTDSLTAAGTLQQIVIPIVPEQGPGISFEIKPSGLIGLADSGPATRSDMQQIADLRDVLLDALDDAISHCENTNAFAGVARIASKYKETLLADPLSIDKLYAWGQRLENFNTSIAAKIKSGDLPDKDLGLAEALDSVLALHGTSVLLTGRGQELVTKGNNYRRTLEEQIAYREKALALVEKLKARKTLVEREAVEALEAATRDMGTGRHPERSSELAEAGNSNILGLLSKIAVVTAVAVVGKGLAATVPGQIGSAEVTEIANAAWHFLLEHKVMLREFATIGGQQLSYLQSVLNVMTRFGTIENFTSHLSNAATAEGEGERDEDAEKEARRLILAGQPVPDLIAKKVRILDIEDENITTLENLRNLINLTVINASNNRISDLSPISGLTTLQSLDASDNQISDLSPISGLTTLQSLDASYNQISDLSPISGLTALHNLEASHNQISDLSPISGLPALPSLDSSHNQISDLSPIAELTALLSLDSSHNQISDLSPIAELTALQRLYASDNQISDLSPISRLTTLQNLSASENQISDLSPIAGLTALQNLFASFNQISDLSPIAGLTALQRLYASDNQISDLSPISQLTGLQSLFASDNQISDLSPISGLTGLQRLDASDNQISDLSPIAELTALQRLDASDNQISDLSPISGLTALQSLDVSDNQISDLSPIAELSELLEIDISRTHVHSLTDLEVLPELKYLGMAQMLETLVVFAKWPKSLQGVCLIGTPWPARPAIADLKTAILADGTLAGEIDTEFLARYSVYLTKEARDTLEL